MFLISVNKRFKNINILKEIIQNRRHYSEKLKTPEVNVPFSNG